MVMFCALFTVQTENILGMLSIIKYKEYEVLTILSGLFDIYFPTIDEK